MLEGLCGRQTSVSGKMHTSVTWRGKEPVQVGFCWASQDEEMVLAVWEGPVQSQEGSWVGGCHC